MPTPVIQLYKNAYSGLPRQSWLLSFVNLINRSGTMVVPFMFIYCVDVLKLSVLQAGYIMAFFGLGSICGSFLGGKLTDKIGFYDMQVGALLSGGVLFMVLGFQHTFISICIFAFILSVCNEAFRPANAAAIAHYSSPTSKTRSYALHRLSVNLGWAFGSALGGFLASINYQLLFWVDGCTNILAGLVLLKLIPRSGIKKVVHDAAITLKKASAYKDKVYLFFIGLSTLYGLCFFQFFIMEPVYFKSDWHLNELHIGLLMALNGVLIAVVEMVMINYLDGKRHGLVYIIAGVLVTAVGIFLMNILPGGVIAALIIVIIITFGEMLSMPFANTYWISRTTPHNRGEYAGLYNMSWSAAQILAPVLGGIVISYGGFNLLWWLLGALCLLTMGGFIWLYNMNDNRVAIEPELPSDIPALQE
jgi:predicted MFS family arabinose efflux permease